MTSVCLLICAFVYVYLPETKGRSLEDMSVYFAEITNDESILSAENKLRDEQEMAQVGAGSEQGGTLT